METFILRPGATTGFYGAPEASADLLCDDLVLVVDHCIFFWSTNRLLRDNVIVADTRLSYNRSPKEIQNNIACFSECCENFK